jgi:hypothetical protein
VIERCLARDVKSELEWATHTTDVEFAGTSPSAGWRRALPWALFGVTALGLAALAWLQQSGAKSTVSAEPVQFEIPLPKEPTRFTASFALSPDGRKLAFAAAGADGIARIWIRDLASLEMRPLAKTGSMGYLLVWSPDGRSIAFDSGGKLLKIDVSGGFAKALCHGQSGP